MLDSIAPAIVSFTVGVGLGKMFGKKHGYKVQESQELIAQVEYMDIGSEEPGADSSGKSTWIQGSGEPGADSLGKYMDTRESGADSPCKVHR